MNKDHKFNRRTCRWEHECDAARKSQALAVSSKGYALVLVLSGIAVLSLMLETITVMSGKTIERFTHAFLHAQLECAADSGISEAILALSDSRRDQQWPTDGSPHALIFEGIPVRISIENDLGKVDLNGADESLLAGLFTASGLNKAAADTYAERVLDWREPDDKKRLNGAKAADYKASGLSYQPRGAPFQTVDELQLVLGMSAELYQRVEPAVTVYSDLAYPQWYSAPPIVLQAMGMDAASIEVILADRIREQTEIAAGGLGTNQFVSVLGQPATIFTINAQATSGGMRYSERETIRFTGSSLRPYWILYSGT